MDKNFIRYRAKIADTDAWIYGIPARVYKENYIDSIIDDKGKNEYIKTDTLSRIVGLKDINGKDAYFGDIVKLTKSVHKGKPLEIVYDDFGIPVFMNDMLIVSFSDYFLGLGERNGFEIIGNVFDNKELLK